MPEVAVRPVAVAATYVPVTVAAFGPEGRAATPVAATAPLPVTDVSGGAPRYSAGTTLTPAAAATDIVALGQQFNGRAIALRRVSISGTASAAATIDLLLQRSPNGGGLGTGQPVARHDPGDAAPTGTLWTYAANRTANGNGVSSSRPVLRSGKLVLGTANTAGNTLEWRFDADRAPAIKSLSEWFVINLAGQSLPAGASLAIDIEWAEPLLVPVLFAGDSTTSAAAPLFAELTREGATARTANIQNMGSNGYRLIDYLLHTSGIPFPQGSGGVLDRFGGSGTGPNAAPGQAGVLVLCFGINDVRQGANGTPELISMIDAAVHATLNGTTAGAIYVSPIGAGTSFTWPANIAPNPDARIILWGPNSLATDGNTGGTLVTATGLFTGKTIADAAQMASDILRDAYGAFVSDPRVHSVAQKQTLFGRTATAMAQSRLMIDMLHPNSRGHQLSARQIMPVLRQAIGEVVDLAR